MRFQGVRNERKGFVTEEDFLLRLDYEMFLLNSENLILVKNHGVLGRLGVILIFFCSPNII